MAGELAKESWKMAPLQREEYGPYGNFPLLSDEEKREVRDAYRRAVPKRVPVGLGTNDRIFMLDPSLNTEGLGYEKVFSDSFSMLVAQLRHQYLLRMRHHLFCDQETLLPEQWKVSVQFQNVYEAAFFGCPIRFRPGEVPDTSPILSDDNKRSIFDVDIDRPLDRGIFKRGIEMVHEMREIAKGRTFMGRPVGIEPYLPGGTDGPLTVSMNLRGPAILTDLYDDPDFAGKLFGFITSAALKRNRAVKEYWGLSIEAEEETGMADDSIALIGPDQYREHLLPHHRRWYDTLDPDRKKRRSIHLCGNATRHFKTIHEELGVASFDTGFPVDFFRIREELGKDVEILGGVEVHLLRGGSPAEVYQRARSILESGILEGGRFTLREANNLPPRVPWGNLAAMYKAAFDFGVLSG